MTSEQLLCARYQSLPVVNVPTWLLQNKFLSSFLSKTKRHCNEGVALGQQGNVNGSAAIVAVSISITIAVAFAFALFFAFVLVHKFSVVCALNAFD